jgi:hypothetical protein
MDEEPINFTMYVMAARLSVLHEADQSARSAFEREAAPLEAAEKRGTKPTPAQLDHLRMLADAVKSTTAALEQGRETMRKTWAKVDDRDIAPSPAPILFTGEDFLASLLVVDAMGQAKDVQHWFLPVAQRVMSFQDLDGGLRYQGHIDCEHPHIRDCCYPPFQNFPGVPGGRSGCACHEGPQLARPGAMLPQFCIYQRHWCARDRVFITSAGLMILTADTPYRETSLGLKAANKKAIAR